MLPISNILAGIRAHLWESPSPDSLKQAYGGALTLEELRGVRRGLLQVVAVFLKASAAQQNALSTDDVQVSSLFSRRCKMIADKSTACCSRFNAELATTLPALPRHKLAARCR